MEWLNLLSLGHELIDHQHRNMLQCLGDLEKAVLERRPLRLAYAISQFRMHALEHLETEEAVMRASGYPRLAEHLAEHDAFRGMLGALQRKSVHQALSCDMVEDFAYWLIDHVVRSDRDYAMRLKGGRSRKITDKP